MPVIRDESEQIILAKMEHMAVTLDSFLCRRHFSGIDEVKKFNDDFDAIKTLVAAGDTLPAIRIFMKILRGV